MTTSHQWIGALTHEQLFDRDLRAPAEALVDIEVTERGPDWLEGRMTWGLGPSGHLGIGQLGVLMDLVCGRSIITHLTPGQGARTASLRIDAVAPPPAPGEVVTVRARPHSFEGFAVSTASLTGDDGREVAIATGRFAVVDNGSQPRPPEPASTDPEVAPFEPLGVDTEGAETRMTFRPDVRVSNNRQHAHGGTHFCFAEVAAQGAIDAALAGAPCRLVDLGLVFHRPLMVDGSTLHTRSRVDRLGRTLGVVSAELVNPAGKAVTSALATYSLGA